MVLEGTVVNGVIVPDGPPPPEGTRVRVEFAADDDWEDAPPPPDTETREEFLESLRQSIAEVAAGEKGMSVEEAFAQGDAEIRRIAAEQGE